MWYTVFDMNFKEIGRVFGLSAEDALQKAKEKYFLLRALMVEPEKAKKGK